MSLATSTEILFMSDTIDHELGQFVEFLDAIEMPEEYVVIGGANLVLRGIKPATRDIDMLVSEDLFNVMNAHPKSTTKEPPAQAKKLGADNLSVIPHFSWNRIPMSLTVSMGDGWFPMHFDQYRDDRSVNFFRDRRLVPLDDIWESKCAIQRPTDRDDLLLIAKATGRDINSIPVPKLVFTAPFYS